MNRRLKLGAHLVAQILAQAAVVDLVPISYKPVFAALIAIVGVIVAFLDNPQ